MSLLAMVVCAGAFALVYLRADARVQVLAVNRAVAAGQLIVVADLRVVRVVPDSTVEVVPALNVSRVVGSTAAVPLAAGSLLTRQQLGPAVWPPSGQAVVAVPVKAGRFAAGIIPGAKVLVFPVAVEGEPQPTSSVTALAAPVRATVVGIASADGSGSWVVSLLIPRQQVVRVAGGAGEVSIAVAQG